MVFVFFVLGALIVFAIAAVFVGGETFRLRTTPTTAVFDMDEAVASIADGLSTDAASGLTFDEVQQLVLFTLEHLEAKGLTAMQGADVERGDTPEYVLSDNDAVGVVLDRADKAGLEVTDTAVVEVQDLLLEHLRDIGAIGPAAAG